MAKLLTMTSSILNDLETGFTISKLKNLPMILMTKKLLLKVINLNQQQKKIYQKYNEETPDEETPDEETPYDTLAYRIYAYVNSPETPNFSIFSNASRIETPERFFPNPPLPSLFWFFT